MNLIQIIFLAFIQGMAELLPVSSSAHVIVAEKLMGLDPTAPAMVFLLVMLHTGTMFAVLCHFWNRWKKTWESYSKKALLQSLFIATAFTGVVGLSLKKLIEEVILGGEHAEIEQMFGNLAWVGSALLAAGILILIAGKFAKSHPTSHLSTKNAAIIGMVQGLCLPFRGFSRSGATISTGMMIGISKELAEDFSFALAVILTPPVILRSLLKLVKTHELAETLSPTIFFPGLAGMVFSFIAGLFALRLLSNWIERGRWHWFGYYCIGASCLVFILHSMGY